MRLGKIRVIKVPSFGFKVMVHFISENGENGGKGICVNRAFDCGCNTIETACGLSWLAKTIERLEDYVEENDKRGKL